jgi:hypothetical protein
MSAAVNDAEATEKALAKVHKTLASLAPTEMHDEARAPVSDPSDAVLETSVEPDPEAGPDAYPASKIKVEADPDDDLGGADDDRRDIYPASRIKRRRRTNAQVDQLDEQILEALRGNHPASIRHAFYLMTNPRLPEPVEKTQNGYLQVQDRMVKLRRDGRLPYEWITDASRSGSIVSTFDGVGEFLRYLKCHYRADPWRDADAHVSVWTESRSIAGVIEDICDERAVPLFPCGGFASITFAHEAAQRYNRRRDGRPLVALFIGDYDKSGRHINESLEDELRLHLHKDIELDFRRIAITPEQIADYDLPTKPGKGRDLLTVEAEAMPPHILRQLLLDEIESFLPLDALEAAAVQEAEGQEIIERLADFAEGRGPLAQAWQRFIGQAR